MEENLRPSQAPSLVVQVLSRAFEAMGCGSVFLDSDKRIVHLSERAQRAFGTYFCAHNGRLCAQDRQCDLLLQTMLDQHLKYGVVSAEWPRQAVGVTQADRRPMIVRSMLMDLAAGPEIGGAALVLMLIDPDERPAPSGAVLRQVYGMTKAEARLATRLIGGASLQDVANRTGVTVGTVRCQMKALFAKTGTHRQADLVALLTRLAIISDDR